MNVKRCEYLKSGFSHEKSPNLGFKKTYSQVQSMLLLKLFLFKTKKEIG